MDMQTMQTTPLIMGSTGLSATIQAPAAVHVALRDHDQALDHLAQALSALEAQLHWVTRSDEMSKGEPLKEARDPCSPLVDEIRAKTQLLEGARLRIDSLLGRLEI